MSSNKNETRIRILDTTWDLLETQPGRSLSMGEIAKASGVSRQALYLHFASRAELLIATTHYVDEVKGLDQRLQALESAESGEQMMRMCIQVWGSYIPEIYGVSKALMMSKDSDEAAAAAWSDIMGCLRDVCAQIVQVLDQEGRLSSDWSQKNATDFMWTMISIYIWEQLTKECGWSNEQYISHITQTLTSALLSK
jgi:AcrR family transcriptional regulator